MDIDDNRHVSDEMILEECPIEEEISAKNKPKTWSKGESSKFFKSNRAPSIDVRLKFMKYDSDVVEIPSHGISRYWDSTLIGYFTGRFPGLNATHDLCKKWGVKYSLSNHDNGWLLFKLSSGVDVESVLTGGPYSMWSRTLKLKKMPLGFRFNNFEISVMPVWIKLKFLPMCCWNTTALSLICSKIGRPIHSERMTLSMERVSYVRVLVEVDAAEPLVREIKVLVEGVEWTQLVEHKFEPKYYKTCGFPLLLIASENYCGKTELICSVRRNSNLKKLILYWTAVHNFESSDGGRVLILWNAGLVDITEINKTDQFISVNVVCRTTRNRFLWSMVYGRNTVVQRRVLWDTLLHLRCNLTDPWLLTRDVNCILNIDEKEGGAELTDNAFVDFCEFVTALGFKDVASIGCFFTWNNCDVKCKLDRVMVNNGWREKGWNICTDFLASGVDSDHACALSTIFGESSGGKKPFRFYNMWTKHVSFSLIVSDGWDRVIGGKKQFVLCKKLKGLKKDLKILNKRAFGHIG
ncbi:hypothetical protein ACS0TY_024164 [Phlomoides rotata]